MGLEHYHHHDVMEEGVELIVMGEGVGHAHDVKAAVGEGHFCLEEVVALGYCVVEEEVELDHHDDHVHVLEGVGLWSACWLLTVDWLPLSLHASLQSHK